MLALLQNMQTQNVGFNPTLCAALISEARNSQLQNVVELLSKAMSNSEQDFALSEAFQAINQRYSSASYAGDRLVYSVYLAVVAFLQGNKEAAKNWLCVAFNEVNDTSEKVKAEMPTLPSKTKGDVVFKGILGGSIGNIVFMINPVAGGVVWVASALWAASAKVEEVGSAQEFNRIEAERKKFWPQLKAFEQIKSLLQSNIAKLEA
jgi:hypothetical protein